MFRQRSIIELVCHDAILESRGLKLLVLRDISPVKQLI